MSTIIKKVEPIMCMLENKYIKINLIMRLNYKQLSVIYRFRSNYIQEKQFSKYTG